MAGVLLDGQVEPEAGFSVAHQRVDLELDFAGQLRGTTEITIYPDSKSLKTIKLHSRQCQINNVLVNDLSPAWVEYEDPCDQLTLHTEGGVHQHHILSAKIRDAVLAPPERSLSIGLPKQLRIEDVDIAEVHTQTAGIIKITRPEKDGVDAAETIKDLSDTSVAKFTPLTLKLEFSSLHAREALHFVTGKGRWPQIFTRGQTGVSSASSLFPCVDLLSSRNTWDISIKCSRTVRDVLKQSYGLDQTQASDVGEASSQNFAGREMLVICSGELTDDIIDKSDASKKTVSFSCSQQLSAQQIGFAIGPFEQVPLADLRDAQTTEELGRNAVELTAYCLPGRVEEVRNTCLPTANAIDWIVRKYIACPFRAYSMCFVEDIGSHPAVFAGTTMHSTKLLYPEDVIDTAQDVTRTLVSAIASQWMGINIIPEQPQDTWAILGCAQLMTDLFMKELCGNNEYRFRMKQISDLACELDIERPSIYDMGAYLHIDPSEKEFLSIKSPLVLFILDRRIAKAAGTSKMPAIIAKILTRARTGDLANNCLSTDLFQKTCERFYHVKIDDFMSQWVKGAGTPRFEVTQRFNKKKLVVEMMIRQVQGTGQVPEELRPDTFLRDVREDFNGIYAAQPQNVFTGPMTIRIHEADGTPYEHIVDIKDAQSNIEVPYNTKYKRLKRNKRQKNRPNTKANPEGDEENEALVYCLGDVLQSEEDVVDWRLTDWSAEDEERMSAESYEWIRIDADFEWICRTRLLIPGYMFASQLQQDRDVVAQLQSIQHITQYPATPLISTILLRTMMDRRYFHGIRSAAARGLVKQAKMDNDANNIGLFHLKKAFEELYCVSERGSWMTRPNDFSDQLSYFLQCSIVEALSLVRDDRGNAPLEVKEFLLDKLKFNDNSLNSYSDAFYIGKLMKAVSTAVAARSRQIQTAADLDQEEAMYKIQRLEQDCLAEVDRYRRMDEWTSSYQNLYSRTALTCQSLLSEAGVGKFSPLHFLQYTRPGNYDMLRQSAYDILIKPNVFECPSVLRYILQCMVADASPWIRYHLRETLGRVMGIRALGITKADVQQPQDELVVEDEAAAEKRQKDIQRRQTIDGATEALKAELSTNEAMKQFLWDAICYPDIGLDDLQPLLEFCRLLYEPVDSAKVALQYPRYWRVEKTGKVCTSQIFVMVEADSYSRASSNLLGLTACARGACKNGHRR